MVGNLCLAADAPAVFDGFEINPSKVKCYMEDTGLLMTLAAGGNYLTSDLYKAFMSGKLSVNKGMITENAVAQMLAANGHPLRFYEKIVSDGSTRKKYEVDFLMVENQRTTPIEVKSGNTKKHSSIDYFCTKNRNNANRGIILTKGDQRLDGGYRYLPLPMAMFL